MKTIQDLSKEVGMPAQKIRRLLRQKGEHKETPYYWVWSQDGEYKKIKETLLSSNTKR